MEDVIKIEHGDREIVEVHCEPPRKKQTVLITDSYSCFNAGLNDFWRH